MEWLPALAIFVLAGLSVYRPLWGMAALSGLMILGDKGWAQVRITVAGFPLYVTEAALAGIMAGHLAVLYRRRDGFSLGIPRERGLSGLAWAGFYGSGIFSFARGLFSASAVRVLRDSSLVYYSVFAHLFRRLVDNIGQFKGFFIVLALATGLKIVASLVMEVFFPVRAYFFQPAAYALYLGCLVAGSLFTMPLWLRRHKWWLAVCVLAVAEMLRQWVRSAWVGFAAFLLFYLFAAFFFKLSWKHAVLSLGVLSLGVLLSLPPLPRLGPAPALVVSSSGVPSFKGGAAQAVGVPWSLRPGDSLEAGFPDDGPLEGKPSSPGGALEGGFVELGLPEAAYDLKPGGTPLPSTPDVWKERFITLKHPIFNEMRTLLMGIDSPNLKTRLCFWTDLVEEVFLIRLPFFEDMFNESVESEVKKKYFGTDKAIRGPFGNFLVNSRIVRVPFGVPFGRIFLPSRIFWWLYGSTRRLDPHNSHLAVLYRTGLVGFVSYVLILVAAFRSGFRFARGPVDQEVKCLMLANLGCLIYYFVHTCFDVVLENPYKGMYFWLLIGSIHGLIGLHSPKRAR